MHYSLTPEELRQATVVNHCLDLLEESAVEMLGDPIVLQRVMDRQLPSGALFVQVCVELFAKVFAPSVCAKHLDSDTLLSQQLSLKCFVQCEGFAFLVQKIHTAVVAGIIGEADVVQPLVDSFNRSWSPKVGVDLVAYPS
jgi:hypothetical protein